MTRLSRVVIVAGAAVALAALSEIGPTNADAAPVARTGNLAALAAPQPSASCTYTFDGSVYSTTVTWSGFSVTSIDVFTSGSTQPVVQATMHPTRSGSRTFPLSVAPSFANVTGPKNGLRPACVAAT
jgi:hypothetical protein